MTQGAVTIRAATSPAEIEAVQGLCWAYRDALLDVGQSGRVVVETFYPAPRDADVMSRLSTLHRSPDGAILLALKDNTPVGCGMFHRFDATTCEWKRIFVAPAARDLGTGRALCLALEDLSRRAGYRRVVLDTITSLTAARSLYRDLGFQDIGPYYDAPPASQGHICFYQKDLSE